ncbi:MAG: MOSC domain-containing protein [Eggerthellaceae bacterium]|nr:MOSC domain-containing protein [Eggerthellaceae bacterium]
MGTVRAVCTSTVKGVQKEEAPYVDLRPAWGIEDDAHAGPWHRQVSLLSFERIREFNERGAGVANGAFGENLIVEGFDLKSLPVGTRLRSGDVLLELTQIGKECHAHCAIYHKMGDCIMPREGVFCRVLEGGRIAPGNPIEIEG